MRHLLAALLVLPLAAPAPAPAQAQEDLRTNPLTGEPRLAADPISYDETTEALRACMERSGPPTAETALACTEETQGFCARVLAEYPLAVLGRGDADPCLLNSQLAWGEVRFAAGQEIIDAFYDRIVEGKEALRPQVEAFSAEDDAWRVEVGNSCLGDMEPDARNLCELDLQRDRAVLYLERLAALPAQ